MMSCILLTIIFVISTADATSLSRISGGQATTISQYPFAAALLSDSGSGTFLQSCGGTIISSSAILSAASCYHTGTTADPPARWRTRIGSTYSASGGFVHLIRLITRHPNFNHNSLDSDIAVLRTTTTLLLASGTAEVAVFAGSSYPLVNQQTVTAIGWGATSVAVSSSNVLRRVQMWIVNQETCANRYTDLGVTITSNMLCAGWFDGGTAGQCLGDTGSPLLHNGVVVGVYSWTQGCGLSRYPNINTRVPLFARWIVATAIAA